MPELPEVEVLLRHLKPQLEGRVIGSPCILQARPIRPDVPRSLASALQGCRINTLSRRSKFLIFDLATPPERGRGSLRILGHLGMTGRMFLQPLDVPIPKHTVLHFSATGERFVFQDVRRFGRFTSDLSSLQDLGPEPWDAAFTPRYLQYLLQKSKQAIKVRLLDQSIVCGLGNIYVAEALFRSGIDPRTAAGSLTQAQCERLVPAIQNCLQEAVDLGTSLALGFDGTGSRDGLFYYGSDGKEEATPAPERFQVYDRAGSPCRQCNSVIQRIVQAARSTFYCPHCQRRR